MKTHIKDINFLPQHIILARKKRKNLFIFSVASLLVAGVIGWVCWYPYHLANSYQERLISLNNELEKLESAEPFYEQLIKNENELQAKRDALAEIKDKQMKVTQLLKDISSILPASCYVANLDIKSKDELTVNVVTNSPVETARVLVGLRSLGIFDQVGLAEAGDIPFTEGPKPVEFKLKFFSYIESNQEESDKTGSTSNEKEENDSDGHDIEETKEVNDIEDDNEINSDSIKNEDKYKISNEKKDTIINENTTDGAENSGNEIDFDEDLEQQLKQMEKEMLEKELDQIKKQ